MFPVLSCRVGILDSNSFQDVVEYTVGFPFMSRSRDFVTCWVIPASCPVARHAFTCLACVPDVSVPSLLHCTSLSCIPQT
jgi:hypothetical protein